MRKVTRSLPAPRSLDKASVPRTKKVKGGAAPAAPAVPPTPTNELDRAKKHFLAALPTSGKRPAFPFKAYKADGVRTQLFKDFHDKCAYCESRYAPTSPVDIEHFRPKGRVKNTKGDGYWWLAMAWDNLLPACIECNRHRRHPTPTPPTRAGKTAKRLGLDERKGVFTSSNVLTTGKQDAFPITGRRLAALTYNYQAEGALLLDPCRDEPDQHLHFHIDPTAPLGLVLPKATRTRTTLAHLTPVPDSKTVPAIRKHAASIQASERGAVSIQTYGLNRLQLVRERTRVLRRLEFYEQLLIETAGIIQDLHAPTANRDARKRSERAITGLQKMQAMIASQIRELAHESAPYSVMVKAWAEDFRRRAALMPAMGP